MGKRNDWYEIICYNKISLKEFIFYLSSLMCRFDIGTLLKDIVMNTNKIKFKQLLLSLVVVFAAYSCGKEDPVFSTTINQFEYNGLTIGLINGAVIDNQTTNNESADFDIVLSTPDLQITGYAEVIGTGSAIHFDLNSTSATTLTAGTYSFSAERNPGTLFEAFAQIDYNSDIPEEEKTVDFVGGNLTLSISNDEYTLAFTLNTSDNQTLTGTYKGALTAIAN